jgi:group I intron endonuclease
MVIYKITNKINSKIYIGLTTRTISNRWSNYKSEVKYGKRNHQAIIRAMQKHGIENFHIEIIDRTSSKEELKILEMHYIKLFNSTDRSIGYNISKGGDLHSDEIIKKRSLKIHGRKHSEESKRKISASLTGIKHTEERKKNISKAHLGQNSWNTGTKGIMKPNSGSFQKGQVSPNKGKKRVLINGKIKLVSPEDLVS